MQRHIDLSLISHATASVEITARRKKRNKNTRISQNKIIIRIANGRGHAVERYGVERYAAAA